MVLLKLPSNNQLHRLYIDVLPQTGGGWVFTLTWIPLGIQLLVGMLLFVGLSSAKMKLGITAATVSIENLQLTISQLGIYDNF